MKHIRLHDYLRTFIDAEEVVPVTPPEESSYDANGSDGVDASTNPRVSGFDLLEMFGSMPSDGFATEPIPLETSSENSPSGDESEQAQETVNPGA